MTDLPERIWAFKEQSEPLMGSWTGQDLSGDTEYLRADLLPGKLARALLAEDGWSGEFEDYTESTQQEYLDKAKAILARIGGGK